MKSPSIFICLGIALFSSSLLRAELFHGLRNEPLLPRPNILGKIDELRWKATVGTGYKAKSICSGMFNSGKSAQTVVNEDLRDSDGRLDRVGFEVDRIAKAVTAYSPLPLYKFSVDAEFVSDKLGCVIPHGRNVKYDVTFKGSYAEDVWDTDVAEDLSAWDEEKLKQAFADAFNPKIHDGKVRTKAVLVLHKGKIVGEQYAPGITKDTALPGWSMSKTVTNALVGILVKKGLINIKDPIPVPEWKNDKRKNITWEDLMRYTSGLKFDETYANPLSDVTQMIYGYADMAGYAARQPQIHERGKVFNYSTGSTNILTRQMRDFFPTHQEYLNFPFKELFAKLGMKSAKFEIDANGSFTGGLGVFASARDWAKFGYLYSNGGKFKGEQIIPEGWVDWAKTATPLSKKGEYGAGLWTNGSTDMAQTDRPWTQLKSNDYALNGYNGQNIMIIPDKELVLVRLGSDDKNFGFSGSNFADNFVKALKK